MILLSYSSNKEINWALIYVFHMTGNIDMHLLVTDTLNKCRGVDQITSQYLV
jgi:hypothetical protein